MYYESIPHREVKVNSAAEAAERIKNHEASEIDALTWTGKNGLQYYAVSDAHIDGTPFGETALILKKENKYIQVESITVAWIKTTEEVTRYFEEVETTPYNMGETQLIIGQPNENQLAWFTCGCCGNSLKGKVAKQLTYHQDNGYGFCPKCEQFYF